MDMTDGIRAIIEEPALVIESDVILLLSIDFTSSLKGTT